MGVSRRRWSIPRAVLACAVLGCLAVPNAWGGAWLQPVNHTELGVPDRARPSIRADAAGDVWLTFSKDGGDLYVSFRPAGGDWQPPHPLGHGAGLVLAVDRAGNAITAWQDSAGD